MKSLALLINRETQKLCLQNCPEHFRGIFDEQYVIDYLDNKICGSNLRTES